MHPLTLAEQRNGRFEQYLRESVLRMTPRKRNGSMLPALTLRATDGRVVNVLNGWRRVAPLPIALSAMGRGFG